MLESSSLTLPPFFLEAQSLLWFPFAPWFGGSVPLSGALLLRVKEPVDSASDQNALAPFPRGSLRVWKQEAGRRESSWRGHVF